MACQNKTILACTFQKTVKTNNKSLRIKYTAALVKATDIQRAIMDIYTEFLEERIEISIFQVYY
jgi:hypothetical protein